VIALECAVCSALWLDRRPRIPLSQSADQTAHSIPVS